MKYLSYRGLIQHTAGFPHSVLTSVQVESLVLQDLPLPHDVPHLPVQEPGEGGDQALIASSDVLLLQQAQSGGNRCCTRSCREAIKVDRR